MFLSLWLFFLLEKDIKKDAAASSLQHLFNHCRKTGIPLKTASFQHIDPVLFIRMISVVIVIIAENVVERIIDGNT